MVLYGTNDLQNDKQAYDLLTLAVGEQWGLPRLPELRREEGGKPFFSGPASRQFNLSHSGTMALCALDSSPVGVDIQVVKQWQPKLPARVCCQAELDWLEKQPDPGLGFALLWSLKEARVKQSGLGLRTHIREIRVPLAECRDGPVLLDELWFRTYLGENWAASACGLTPPPAEIFWRALKFSPAP